MYAVWKLAQVFYNLTNIQERMYISGIYTQVNNYEFK